MKQFFKMFFASMLAIIVSSVIVVGVIVGIIAVAVTKTISGDEEENNRVSSNSVLVIDLDRKIHELSERNSFIVFNKNTAYSPGLYHTLLAIRHAKTNDKIKGIFIKPSSGNRNGFATMEQLRAAIKDFKSSGKFVYAYGEGYSQPDYFVASAADSIYLNPVGHMELKGFATVLAFFKGTLEKLEIQPEIFYAGKYKSATEPFRSDKISEPNREQIAAFLSSFWGAFLSAASEHSHLDTAAIHQLAYTGAIELPADALKYKLIDGIAYRDQVEKLIRSKTGKKDDEDIDYISIEDYAKNNRPVSKEDGRIALLFAEGNIVDGETENDYEIASETIVESIRKIAEDDKIKAVVMRVNSPGGSALASDVILRELNLLKAKKPLVVSMGDLAASGGYYISCQADSIFAMPNTVTGSIGVFGVMFNSEQLMKNKLGVTFDNVKTTPYADFPTVTRPLTEEEKQKMQRSVDHIYEVFKTKVSEGRKLDMAYVDSIAQGRVWTGNAALQNHLVDAIGNLDRAFAAASSLAKMKDYRVVTYPAPVNKFESMMKRFSNASGSSITQKIMEEEMTEEYEYYKQLKNFRRMNGKSMMALPYTFHVE